MVQCILCFTLFLTCFIVFSTDAWQGNYEKVVGRLERLTTYCKSFFWWWGCSNWGHYWEIYDTIMIRCRPGWSHNGDNNCNIPICNPVCANGGVCINPNECSCPSISTGPYCKNLTCSYQRPCYPGECVDGSTCTCSPGFSLNSTAKGCITFLGTEERLRPKISQSNVTIKNIRRSDNRINFMFVLEAQDANLSVVWSNQKQFNHLTFEMKAFFDGLENLPKRPLYVYETEMGIAKNIITANVSKLPRSGGQVRDQGTFKEYMCDGGVSRDSPQVESATCILNDYQFMTLIEHGDWLTVEFRSLSGGFQRLVNIDKGGVPYATNYYNGLSVIRTVEFRFDFTAPKHCSEVDNRTCPFGATILDIPDVFNKNPIRPRWLGWTDDPSGVGEYYIEVFKLGINGDRRLVETSPLQPVYSAIIPHTNGAIQYPEYEPSSPGMYSVLLEVRDLSNNTRIARRFVL
ncbi:hypothetical protein DPMN_059478 [Dreissena polymorpha]|uniref:EGF-like domain-containing protein n=1 Tax=Dreissena polymorpha TaxID=45954 RepID=A0A9D4HGM7_DREPO|nr:hypothetical protein DPMN_059478 [Dreissena polymorpha]